MRNNTILKYTIFPKSELEYTACLQETLNHIQNPDDVRKYPGFAVIADLKLGDARALKAKPAVCADLA